MNEEEQKCLESLPQEFLIYRAMSKKEFESGKFRFSWTLSKKIAEEFINRNKLLYKKEMILHEMMANKNDVIAYLNRREEEEIIYMT